MLKTRLMITVERRGALLEAKDADILMTDTQSRSRSCK